MQYSHRGLIYHCTNLNSPNNDTIIDLTPLTHFHKLGGDRGRYEAAIVMRQEMCSEFHRGQRQTPQQKGRIYVCNYPLKPNSFILAIRDGPYMSPELRILYCENQYVFLEITCLSLDDSKII